MQSKFLSLLWSLTLVYRGPEHALLLVSHLLWPSPVLGTCCSGVFKFIWESSSVMHKMQCWNKKVPWYRYVLSGRGEIFPHSAYLPFTLQLPHQSLPCVCGETAKHKRKALKQNISFSISHYLFFILWQIQFSVGFPDGAANIRVIDAYKVFLFYLSI